MRMSVIVLVMLCAACGSSVTDESAGPQSSPRVSRSHVEKVGESRSRAVGDTAAPITQSAGHMSISSIPFSVAKDLQSPEARDRYRALDYWDAKDSQAPLDPVFEAIEDDDPAVRAKATAIVEQYWATEEERENQ